MEKRSAFTLLTTQEDYTSTMVALQQKLESMSSCFLCRDLLFDDGHHLSKVILQRKALTCKSLIKKDTTTTTTGNSSWSRCVTIVVSLAAPVTYLAGLEEPREKKTWQMGTSVIRSALIAWQTERTRWSMESRTRCRRKKRRQILSVLGQEIFFCIFIFMPRVVCNWQVCLRALYCPKMSL